jgi:FAD/FMN-containing dehydrogenase
MHGYLQSLTRRDALKVLGAGAAAAAADLSFPTAEGAEAAVRISRQDSGYEAARRGLTWNARMPDQRPTLIVRAHSAADVAAAVREARERHLTLALRGGGHSYYSAFLREGSLLIDTGGLKTLEIDKARRTASLGPGVKGGELLAALEPTGLGFPVGHCPDVGLGGYLLGGGIGWNSGEWGPACMSVTGVDLVLASGETVHADANHNADLFWAVRGAGRGFFAAVTRYEVKLHDARPVVRGIVREFELDSLSVVSQWIEDIIDTVHPSAEVIPSISPAGGGRPPLMTVAAFGMGQSEAEAYAKLGKLSTPPRGAKPFSDALEIKSSFTDLKDGDGGFPNGKRMQADMRFCRGSVPQLLGALKPLALQGSAAPSFFMSVLFGGRALPPHQGNAPFRMNAPYYLGLYSFYDDPAEDRAQRHWIRTAAKTIEPFAAGAYINEADIEADGRAARLCYSAESWQRLQTLKVKYDPEHQFPGFG